MRVEQVHCDSCEAVEEVIVDGIGGKKYRIELTWADVSKGRDRMLALARKST